MTQHEQIIIPSIKDRYGAKIADDLWTIAHMKINGTLKASLAKTFGVHQFPPSSVLPELSEYLSQGNYT